MLKTIIGMVQEGDPGEGAEPRAETARARLVDALCLRPDYTDEELTAAVETMASQARSFRITVARSLDIPTDAPDEVVQRELVANAGLRRRTNTDPSQKAVEVLRSLGWKYVDPHGWTAPPPPVPTVSVSKAPMAFKELESMGWYWSDAVGWVKPT